MHASIRKAMEADIPAMHRVRMSVRENRLRNPNVISQDDYRQRLTVDGHGWVWEEGTQIVAMAIADLRRGSLWALFVEPDFERRGIGRALHECALDWMFESGAQSVWLTTSPHSRAAQFYTAAGWVETGIQPRGDQRFEMTAVGRASNKTRGVK